MELYRLQRSHLAKTALLLVGLCREIDSAIPHGGRRLPLGGVTLDLQRNGRQREGLFSNQDMGSGKVCRREKGHLCQAERAVGQTLSGCMRHMGWEADSLDAVDARPIPRHSSRLDEGRRGPPRCGATSASSPSKYLYLRYLRYIPRGYGDTTAACVCERERADEQIKQHFHLRSAYCTASRPGVTTGHTLVR